MEEEEKEEEREEGNSSNPPPLSLPEYIHVLWHLYAISAIKSLYRKVPLESLFFKAFLPNNLHFPSTTLKPPVSSLQKRKMLEWSSSHGLDFISEIQNGPSATLHSNGSQRAALKLETHCLAAYSSSEHAFAAVLHFPTRLPFFFFFFLHCRSHQTNRKGLAFHLLPGNISTR